MATYNISTAYLSATGSPIPVGTVAVTDGDLEYAAQRVYFHAGRGCFVTKILALSFAFHRLRMHDMREWEAGKEWLS